MLYLNINIFNISFFAVAGVIAACFLVACVFFICKKKYAYGAKDIVFKVISAIILFLTILSMFLILLNYVNVFGLRMSGTDGILKILIGEKIIFSVSGIGYLLLSISSPLGMALIFWDFFAIITSQILHSLKAKKNRKKKKNKIATGTEFVPPDIEQISFDDILDTTETLKNISEEETELHHLRDLVDSNSYPARPRVFDELVELVNNAEEILETQNENIDEHIDENLYFETPQDLKTEPQDGLQTPQAIEDDTIFNEIINELLEEEKEEFEEDEREENSLTKEQNEAEEKTEQQTQEENTVTEEKTEATDAETEIERPVAKSNVKIQVRTINRPQLTKNMQAQVVETKEKKKLPPIEIKGETSGEKIIPILDDNGAMQGESLPITKRHIVMNRMNVVNMFSDYLKSKDDKEKEKLANSISTIIIK